MLTVHSTEPVSITSSPKRCNWMDRSAQIGGADAQTGGADIPAAMPR
ncbi:MULTISPECIES: hypothetical protein [Roseiflexus]|nr:MULTISPECIES: hypothetical protein [Roseiflexus]